MSCPFFEQIVQISNTMKSDTARFVKIDVYWENVPDIHQGGIPMPPLARRDTPVTGEAHEPMHW